MVTICNTFFRWKRTSEVTDGLSTVARNATFIKDGSIRDEFMFALRIIEDPSLVANRVTNKDALDVVRLQTFALVLSGCGHRLQNQKCTIG